MGEYGSEQANRLACAVFTRRALRGAGGRRRITAGCASCPSGRAARSVGKADTSNRETGISARQQFGVLPAEHDELREEGGSHRLRLQSLIQVLIKNKKTCIKQV